MVPLVRVVHKGRGGVDPRVRTSADFMPTGQGGTGRRSAGDPPPLTGFSETRSALRSARHFL